MQGNKGNTRHNGYGTRLYGIYYKMKARCYNPNYPERKYYGARGILICDYWLGAHGFEHFREWSELNGYSDSKSIDRIDVNKGYSPENCRWATPKEQSCNKRNNIFITMNGKTQCLHEWCEELKFPYGTVLARIRSGWSIEEAFSKNIRNGRGG